MRKLINGIVEFRRNVRDGYKEAFGKLATGQSPDTLFIACSDSRVVPNTFASTNPGDLFVVRNVGNIIPPSSAEGISNSDESEVAAIEYAINFLKVKDIIVCGHSECGAMRAIVAGRNTIDMAHMASWLRHGEEAFARVNNGLALDKNLEIHNQLSQLNVLLQIDNIKSYPVVKKRIQEKSLAIHGWWFDIAKADVYTYDKSKNRFVLIDEAEAERILSESN